MSSGDCVVAASEWSAIVVCDAGPLIHLEELGCLDLLSNFREILVLDAVWHEVARLRPSALRRRRIRLQRVTVSGKRADDLTRLADTFSLAAGEAESLALMAELPDAVMLTDDAAARLVATQLGYDVHGTLGIIVLGFERKRRTKRQVLNLLRSIPRRSTLYVAESLLTFVIDQVRAS
jgi:predicted nucleic acid-binding protein